MKKWLPCLALCFLVLVTLSCQKPEEVTISKYFNAMKIKDSQTLAAMALEPMSLEFKSWKALSIEEAVVVPYAIPEMDNAMAELKKAKDEQLRLVMDKKYELDTLKSEQADARGRKKAELDAKIKTAEEAYNGETAKFSQLQGEQSKKKAELENEKTLIRLSTGLEQALENYEGKTFTAKARINITTGAGDKEYIFTLRRYELINPATKKPLHNKYVIMKIATPEEIDK